MAILQTSSLSDSYIKTKWNEKYFSEAVNEMSSVNDPGVYRGGVISASTPADKFIRIIIGTDPDTFVLCRNTTTLESQTIKVPSTITFDMSSEFSGGGGTIPSNVKWYVGFIVDYQAGQPTTAQAVVSTSISLGMVSLGAVNMLAGDTVISADKIDMTGNNRTTPRNMREFIVPRTYTTGIFAQNHIQLSGNVYCKGVSANKSNSLVRFSDTDGNPLVASDDYAINAGGWYKNAVLTSPILAADVGPNGYYNNPYVEFDFGDSGDVNYTGQVVCRYFVLKGLDDISDGTDNSQDDKQPIVNTHNVYSDPLDFALTGELAQGIVGGPLNDTLKSIFKQVKNKVEKLLPASSSWILLWSSPSGATYLKNYVYYKDGKIAIVSNGTVSSSGVVTPSDITHAVRAHIFGDITYVLRCAAPFGKTLNLGSVTVDWDNYTVEDSIGNEVHTNVVDGVFSGSIYSEKNVGGGNTATGNITSYGFGFDASQSSSALNNNMSVKHGQIGSTYLSNMTVGGNIDLGLRRVRPITVDISSITGWSGILGGYGLEKTGLSLSISQMAWDNALMPVFRAHIRAWDSTGGNYGRLFPASIKIEESSGYCMISEIMIFGLLPSFTYDKVHLIIDIETYYHTYGGY